jgi:hypothetical protein
VASGRALSALGFIVTNMSRPPQSVVAFYNKRGTCEQWIKEGKGAIRWTRLSYRSFAANAVRLQLHAPTCAFCSPSEEAEQFNACREQCLVHSHEALGRRQVILRETLKSLLSTDPLKTSRRPRPSPLSWADLTHDNVLMREIRARVGVMTPPDPHLPATASPARPTPISRRR